MQVITTTAPISIENLKKYFTDDSIKYLIDYDNSQLQGNKFLIYLGNINVPCDIQNDITNGFLALLADYLNSKMLVEIPILEKAALEVILGRKFGDIGTSDELILNLNQRERFITENTKIIDRWIMILESLTVYNMITINAPEVQDFIDRFPKDESEDFTGINFCNLLKYEEMYLIYDKIKLENLTNFTKFFQDYIFKGKNLFHFWSTIHNPMFLFTSAVANGQIINDKEIVIPKVDLSQIK